MQARWGMGRWLFAICSPFANPVAVRPLPGCASRPWALGCNPFGIECRSDHYANGVISKAQGRRCGAPWGETSTTNIYPEGYTRSPYLEGLRNRRMAALCNPVGVMARWLFAICSPFANFGMQSLRDRMPFRSLRQRGYIPKGETSTTNIYPKSTPLTPKGFDHKPQGREAHPRRKRRNSYTT